MDLKKLATAATPKKLASYVAGLPTILIGGSMDLKKLATAATPKKLASYVAGLRQPTGHGHGTIREDKHNGHRIIIRTTYDIEVDGRKVPLPLSVDKKAVSTAIHYPITSSVQQWIWSRP